MKLNRDFLNEKKSIKLMPFCPVCRQEYVEGIEKCADCGTYLVGELPALQEPDEAETQLVQVCTAGDEIEAQIIRGALKAAGIACVLRGEALRLTHGITADGLAEVKILVRPEDAEQARSVIAQGERTAT